jgi:hypothetical protein
MKSRVVLIGLLLAFASGCAPQGTNYVFEVVDYHPEPVIKKGDPGTAENKYGFEGGTAFKFKGQYHLFTAEMAGDPWWVKMCLGHWKSKNGTKWERISTLYESNGVTDGGDQRAAIWAPMPFYNEEEGRWNVFYVAYTSDPDKKPGWHYCYDGRIYRGISTHPGIDGIDGPYKDAGVVLGPGPDADSWEGLFGTCSFYAYRVGDKWHAFYGSATTENWGGDVFWGIGLASAESLVGPWKRLSSLNPVQWTKSVFENPIVTKTEDGTYLAVYDNNRNDGFGFMVSKDGVHWSKAEPIKLTGKVDQWWNTMRTPLGLIDEGNNEFTVFYTAYGYDSTKHPQWFTGYGCVGMVRLKLKKQVYTDYWLVEACDRV